MEQSMIRSTAYKRTTDKQYSLLTHEMARVQVEDRSGKSANAISYWNNLTEKLNALGPPYRTVQQWKKVWTDFRRFHSKRGFKSIPKFTKTIKRESNFDNEIFRMDQEEEAEENEVSQRENKPATSSKVAQFLRCEWEEYEQSSQSMHSTNSIDYADEYSYPDRQSSQQITPELPETLIPDETPYDSYTYNSQDFAEPPPRRSTNPPPVLNHRSLPPPPRPSNNRLLDQTLYTLQNQMENQTKFLEHLSQISSTMASLMERQVNAVEKQTDAMRRQASATEHHTLVMNSFIEMIREKMPKTNSRTSTTPSTNLSNEIEKLIFPQ